ncbi:MAG: polysaccharide biosynthesis tyrosine autokinase [Salibacteraceae bacterium]
MLRGWYLYLTLALITGVSAYIYIYKVEDLYESRTQLLLNAPETFDYQSSLLKSLEGKTRFNLYEHIASQMRVMKSSSILNHVLDNLNLDVSYFITGRLKTSEVFSHLPFKVTSPNFDANKVRRFDFKFLSEDEYQLTYATGDGERSLVGRFGELLVTDGVYLNVQKTAAFEPYAIETLQRVNYSFKLNNRAELLAEYKSSIELKNIEYTSVVEISIRDNIPERAKMILDTLSKEYINYTLQNKIDVSDNTLRYINRQLEEITEIINEIGVEIEQYKEQRSILNITREEEMFFGNLIELEKELANLELKQRSIDDLIEYVANLDEEEVNLPPSLIVLEDATLKDLINELFDAHLERLDLIGTVSKVNPRYVNITQTIDELRKKILTYLTEFRTYLIKRIQEINQDIRQTEEKIKYIPQDQRQLLNIEKRLLVNEELYSFLLSRRAETIIARAAIVPEVKIIEEPRVSGIVYPDRRSFVLRWLLIGLGIGLALAFLKSFFFDKVETIDELAELTEATILGIIPSLRGEVKHLYEEENTRSRLYESFRSLRANLEFMKSSSGGGAKVIMVTSLNPSEGKTFTSVNLSYVMSRVKKKTLLIDCDLHKPQVRKTFKMDENKGLSQLLTGRLSFDDAVHNFDEYYDILFSGPIPPNASELVASEDFNDLLSSLKHRYDYIVIDTPPIGLITDALVITKLADIKLFILNSKVTSKMTVRHLNEILENSQVENAALILNRAKKPFSRYYYGSYRYYYGYGYGYGYGEGYTYGTNEGEA